VIEGWIGKLAELLRTQLQGSAVFAYPTVFLAGVLTSFTPCVYPMIPILMGYVGNQAKGKKSRGFLLSLAYVLGVAIVYTTLGALAGLSGTFFGRVQSNPWFQIAVGNIIMLCGLVMLGAVRIPVPSFLSGTSGAPRAGLLGAFGMGLASGLVAAPCVTAVLGTLLFYVASGNNAFSGAALLFTFSIGMGTLPLLVGTFTGILKTIPRAGRWMEWVERFFGFAMIALGEYFIIKGARFL
jgi:thiol:disulfide interchange protein DsbD